MVRQEIAMSSKQKTKQISKQALQEYIDKATSYVQEDRALALNLLIGLMDKMKTNPLLSIENTNMTAAKLVETMQRSNEQIVKLASIIQRQTMGDDFKGFTPEESDELLESIQKEVAKEKIIEEK